jgi:hypothetical protein
VCPQESIEEHSLKQARILFEIRRLVELPQKREGEVMSTFSTRTTVDLEHGQNSLTGVTLGVAIVEFHESMHKGELESSV